MKLALLTAGLLSPAALAKDSVARRAARGELKASEIRMQVQSEGQPSTVVKTLPFISNAKLVAIQALLGAEKEDDRLDEADGASEVNLTADLGANVGTVGCSRRDRGDNRRVNQDCTFRRQAEEIVIFNPANPNNLLAAQNDSRVGFNQCSIAFSTDNGEHWGDMIPPFRQKINNPAGQEPTPRDPNRHTVAGGRGTFHTYDFASDPAVAFDSQGRGFFSCVALDIFTDAGLVWVAQSPLGAQGSFFFNLGTFSRQFVVAEDNSPAAFHDKEFIRADTFPLSPNRDNVYVTWTVFNFTCGPNHDGFCEAPIFGSMSTDHGLTWSTPEPISGRNAALCQFGGFFTGKPSDNSKCNFDQGSDPIVLPNGDLVVVFINANTPTIDNQQLAVRCHPTGRSPNGTARLNCAPPTKVGDDVATGEPLCDFGRGPEQCIPGAFIRTNDFPRVAVNRANGNLYVAWQDYRNGEFDIQLATSRDGGNTWSPSVTANPDRGLDHYFAAIDLAERPTRDRVGLSYYRTERVPNENVTPPGGFAPGQPGVATGNSDYVLAGGTALQAPFNFRVISPIFPPPNGIQAGFNGDYSGLTINKGEQAHPIWSDTRNVDPFAPANGVTNDEDVFTDNVDLPEGPGRPSVGRIGRDGGDDRDGRD